jgi:hypothetical protein
MIDLSRLVVHLRASALDRALVDGANPASSRQLELRASMLASARERHAVAEGLERLLAAAEAPLNTRRVRPSARAVLANARELLGLAAVLRAQRPVYARGVALVARMVSDGTGAAYAGGCDEVARSIREARGALDGEFAAGGVASHGPALIGVRRAGRSFRANRGTWIHGRGES